jgi:hypothetical protein
VALRSSSSMTLGEATSSHGDEGDKEAGWKNADIVKV